MRVLSGCCGGRLPALVGELVGEEVVDEVLRRSRDAWLRTNGVNTNGAAAKVMNFDRLGEKVHPGTFGNLKVG